MAARLMPLRLVLLEPNHNDGVELHVTVACAGGGSHKSRGLPDPGKGQALVVSANFATDPFSAQRLNFRPQSQPADRRNSGSKREKGCFLSGFTVCEVDMRALRGVPVGFIYYDPSVLIRYRI